MIRQIVDNALLYALLGVAKSADFVEEVAPCHERHRVLVVRLDYWRLQVPIFVFIHSTPILCFSRCSYAFGKCVLLCELFIKQILFFLSQCLFYLFKLFLVIVFVDVFCTSNDCQFIEIDNIRIHSFINVDVVILLVLDIRSACQWREFYFIVLISLFNVWRQIHAPVSV